MLTFVNNHLDYAYGQNDYELVAKDGQQVVGVITYAITPPEKVVYIQHIEVKPSYRNQGLGQQLIKQLLRNNLGHKINWGMTTPDGTRLKASLERQGYTRFFEWLKQR